MLLAATFLLFASVALGIWLLTTTAEARSTVRGALRQVADYDSTDLRQRELELPLGQRVIAPIARSLASVGRRFVPAGYMESVRLKLVLAGRPGPEEVDRFRAIRVLTVAAAPVAVVATFVLLDLGLRLELVLAALLGVALLLVPEATLNREVEARRAEIRQRLPDVIDLLTISVEAGLGFDQALDRAVTAIPGPLSEEFSRLLGEMRAGAGRSEALRAMDARTDVPELRSFLLALIQAETFGVPVGRILRTQSDEIRVKRRQMAQEEAQKAPVKLLFPMVACIFPGIFVVLVGPAALNFLNSGF